MKKYDEILKQIAELPASFGKDNSGCKESELDIQPNLRQKFSEDDHLVICISRTREVPEMILDLNWLINSRINYYDVEIFEPGSERLEAEKDAVQDKRIFTEFNKYGKKTHESLRTKLKELNRYHGLSKQDAVFFNMSDLICELARTEDCLIMGRCADAILEITNSAYQYFYQRTIPGSHTTCYGCT